MIAIPGVIQAVAELRDGERPGVVEVFHRAPTAANLHEYERSLADASLVARRARPWTQYVLFRYLDDAGENAIVGREGWLFYRPGVRYVVEGRGRPATSADDPLPAIRSFRDQLAARGIRLLVVIAPNKESVYPEKLAVRAQGVGVVVCPRTRDLMDRLREASIDSVNLFDVFRRAREIQRADGEENLYLVQDSHWSALGARLAATAVARQALEGGAVTPGSERYVERPTTARRLGDVLQMLQVPLLEHVTEPETLSCGQVIDQQTGKPYHDEPGARVLVLGDSFLRIYERDEPGSAGFIAHLARELKQPLTSIVNDGGASTIVRQALARRPQFLSNKTLVIWEFVERDIRDGAEGWRIIRLPEPRSMRE
ncbi:MAG: alginate O-acetyltransferase AlgX-related protein [Isosphaeraceae bacterium]